MWCNPKGRSNLSSVPYTKGAKTGDDEDEFAIHTPNAFIPDCIIGHTTDKITDTTTDHKITTRGTNLFPLKKERASGNKIYYIQFHLKILKLCRQIHPY